MMRLTLLVAALLLSQTPSQPLTPDNQPAEPFRIGDNVYFVGSSDISSYLLTSPNGHILIDAGYESTEPQIEANVAKLGFAVRDIKILLNTQAHYDHAAGFSRM